MFSLFKDASTFTDKWDSDLVLRVMTDNAVVS
jgi:hypothetical protein